MTISSGCAGFFGPTELNGNVTCDKFNTTTFPFTLLSMTLEITGSINGTISLTNNAGTSQNVSATTSSQFYAGALPGFSFSSPLFTASFGTGLQSIGPSVTYNSPALDSGLQSTGQMAVNNAFLGNYQNAVPDTFDIAIQTLTGILVTGGGGNIDWTQDTDGAAGAIVRYTYDDGTVLTPEPATVAVLGMGLLALGAARRRRRQG